MSKKKLTNNKNNAGFLLLEKEQKRMNAVAIEFEKRALFDTKTVLWCYWLVWKSEFVDTTTFEETIL